MLRGTTEAMSAAIGGVYSLEVTPFDASFENPTEFSKRIARNVELLLKHESHFDQVVDPAGGSYYIENLTQSIAAEAWKLFLEIEEKGGYTAAYKAGFVAERIDASAAAKDKSHCDAPPDTARRQPVSQLHGGRRQGDHRRVRDAQAGRGQRARSLPRRHGLRGDAPACRSQRQGAQGIHADVRQVWAMARARAQFSCNFFGMRRHHACSDNTFFKSIEEGVKAALESKAQIVVVCASRRRLRRGRSQSQGAARRQGDPRGRRSARLRARTGGAGHHQLHQREVERLGNT